VTLLTILCGPIKMGPRTEPARTDCQSLCDSWHKLATKPLQRLKGKGRTFKHPALFQIWASDILPCWWKKQVNGYIRGTAQFFFFFLPLLSKSCALLEGTQLQAIAKLMLRRLCLVTAFSWGPRNTMEDPAYADPITKHLLAACTAKSP